MRSIKVACPGCKTRIEVKIEVMADPDDEKQRKAAAKRQWYLEHRTEWNAYMKEWRRKKREKDAAPQAPEEAVAP